MAFRSISSTTYASRTNTTITPPAGIVNGDGLILGIFVGASSQPTITQPSGFVIKDTYTQVTDGGFVGRLYIFEKSASSESGNYVVTHTTASTQACVMAFSGCATSGSFIDAISKASANTGNTATAPSITTTGTNEDMVWVGHDWVGSGSLTPPSGYTERLDSLLYAATSVQVFAGASGTVGHANDNSNPWACFLFALKPAAGGTAYTLTAALGTFALSGNATTLRAARQLVAATGARTLAGVAANLKRGLKIPAAAGSFVLSGSAAGLKRTYVLSAAAVAFTLSGKAANLSFGHRLVGAAGSFALSGQSATLRYGRQLSTASASFALLGHAANLVYMPSGVTYVLTAWTGSFSLVGQPATLRAARKLATSSGSFALTGNAAALRTARKIVASAGGFTLTGYAASLVYAPYVPAGYVLTCDTGNLVLTGFPVLLSRTRNGIFVPSPRFCTVAPERRIASVIYERRAVSALGETRKSYAGEERRRVMVS